MSRNFLLFRRVSELSRLPQKRNTDSEIVKTETVLAALGVTVAERARIRLEMRWAADCERFEREYVEKGRWRRISEGDEYGALGQEGSFCRRYYELCGNGKCH